MSCSCIHGWRPLLNFTEQEKCGKLSTNLGACSYRECKTKTRQAGHRQAQHFDRHANRAWGFALHQMWGRWTQSAPFHKTQTSAATLAKWPSTRVSTETK